MRYFASCQTRVYVMCVLIIYEMDRESQFLINKCPNHQDLINAEARNVFSNGLAAAVLKCSLGFNIHGMSDFSINEHVLYLS